MSESAKESITISTEFMVLRPKSDDCLPIYCNEWDKLKSEINHLQTEPLLFHSAGSLLIGAACATLISIWTGAISSAPQANAVVIAWAVVAVCAICGAMSVYFAHKDRKRYRAKAQSVAAQMNLIEERFERTKPQ